MGVVAPKFGEDVAWHPACFICTECREMLVDLTYCVYDDLLYCERHYAEQLKPRCAGCDEVCIKVHDENSVNNISEGKWAKRGLYPSLFYAM